MARKKHLINVHTSTGTEAPSGASLYLGEIAVQHTPNEPALWIKMGENEESEVYEKFIGKTEIINILEDTKILGSGYTYSGLSYINSSTTIADAFSALTNEMINDEKIVAASLNDLNDRVTILEANSGSSEEIEELKEFVLENEEVVAGALNDLNVRVGTIETQMTGDYIPLTGYELASGSSEEELSLTEEDTVNEAFGKLQKQMLDNEEAIAAGLNDLNVRIEEVAEAASHNTGVTALSGAVRSLSAATYYGFGDVWDNFSNYTSTSSTRALSSATQSLSGAVMSISAKTSGVLTLNLNGVEQGKYCPSANTTINLEAIQDVTGADVLLTGYELASGSTEEELAILATDTVNEAFGKIQKQNYDNEAVIAGSLNDLDERIRALEASSGSSGSSEGLEELSGAVVSNVTNINFISGVVETISDNVEENKDSIEFLSGYIETNKVNLEGLSGAVIFNQTSIEYLSGYVEEVEYVAATALNDLDARVLDLDDRVAILEANSGSSEGLEELSGAVVAKEFVIAQAFNDLKGMIDEISGNTGGSGGSGGGGTNIAPLSAAVISLSASVVTLSGNSGGGGADIQPLSSATYAHVTNGDIHVTSSDKTTWSGKQDAINDLSTIRTNAESGMSAYNSVNSLSAATTAHTNNGDIHVTSQDKSTWSSKQDAINDLSTIRTNAESGMSAYNSVNSLSAATTAHTNNGDIHVTSSDKTTWSGKQDAISDLTAIRNGANSGASAYTAMTELSAATTAISNSMITGVTMNSSPKSITNGIVDLGTVLTGETDPTVPSWAKSANKPTYTASEVGAVATSATYFDGTEYNSTDKKIYFKKGNTVISDATIDASDFIKDGMVSSVTITGGNMVITFNTDAGHEDITLSLSDIFDPNDYYTTAQTKANFLSASTTLDNVPDGSTRKLSDYATTGTVNSLSAATTAHTNNGDIHVTSSDKTTWSGKQDAINDLSTIRTNAESGMSAYNSVNSLSSATYAHVTNGDIHVTSSDKTTWSGKQDAINDLSTIRTNAESGMSAYNSVNSLSAATTAMSANVGKIAVTGVTITGTGNAITNATYSDSALSITKGNVITAETLTAITAGGSNVTITNKVAAIPSASTNTFGVVKTGNFITNTNGSIAVSTGTTNTTVARGDQFLAVSGATTAHTGNNNIHVTDQQKTDWTNSGTSGAQAYSMVNTLSGAVTGHTATTIPNGTSSQMHLPSVSASDNGKILLVKNGAWSLETPVSIYTGSGQPAQNVGNDGDIYLQTS